MGEKFSYTAGLATRKEFDDAPGVRLNREERGDLMMMLIFQGVVAAADDPPETTIEPHLEMSYNREMPGDIRDIDRDKDSNFLRDQLRLKS